MKENEISDIENLIRSGFLSQAQNKILNFSRLRTNNRKLNLQLANWARRAGLNDIAIKLLYAIVRKSKFPTQNELAEYSMALIRQGFYVEANEILERPSMESFDKIDLFKSYIHIYQWDNARAKLHLVNYLKKDMPIYDRKIAEINLAACDTILRPDSAEHIIRLEKLQSECERIGAKRLQSNALELMAQTFLYLKNYKCSLEILNQAKQIASLDCY